jgi:hypothetical protein
MVIKRVVTEMVLLHYWDIVRGDAETCSICRDNFFLLLPRIKFGSGFADFDFIEMPWQDMTRGSGFSSYNYLSLGFQERGMQFGQDGQTIMIRVAQRQHGGFFLRLAWDPGITWFDSLVIDREGRVYAFFQGFSHMVLWVGSLEDPFSEGLIEFLQCMTTLPIDSI